MRSSEPMPGNPWPHDMQITVEDRPNSLLDLLWVREAFELQLVGVDLPPKLSDAPALVTDGALTAETRKVWESGWARTWDATVVHAAKEHDAQLFSEMRTTALGSIERIELLRAIAGPNWRDEFGNEPFDNDSYRDWSQRGVDAHRAGRPRGLQDNPERRDLSALIPAWEAGLTKIITIPCIGTYAHKVSASALLITDRTRQESDAYRQALDSFI